MGVVPDDWKQSNITPFFKSDYPSSVTNYCWPYLLAVTGVKVDGAVGSQCHFGACFTTSIHLESSIGCLSDDIPDIF